jgi:hypothetical protein
MAEEQPLGTVLHTYSAVDKETPISAIVIQPPNPYFSIDNVTGKFYKYFFRCLKEHLFWTVSCCHILHGEVVKVENQLTVLYSQQAADWTPKEAYKCTIEYIHCYK